MEACFHFSVCTLHHPKAMLLLVPTLSTVCRGSKGWWCFHTELPASLLREGSCQSRTTHFRHHKASNQVGFWTPRINSLRSFFRQQWLVGTWCGGSDNTSYRMNGGKDFWKLIIWYFMLNCIATVRTKARYGSRCYYVWCSRKTAQ